MAALGSGELLLARPGELGLKRRSRISRPTRANGKIIALLGQWQCGDEHGHKLMCCAGQASTAASGSNAPLLARSGDLGIKRVGIIYSPRKSWWAGVFFVTLSIAIFVVTIVTAIWKN